MGWKRVGWVAGWASTAVVTGLAMGTFGARAQPDDRAGARGREPARPGVRAQAPPPARDPAPAGVAGARVGVRERAAGPSVSVQDALVRPFDLPFGRETTLGEVAMHLGRMLNAQVVLDPAALERHNLTEHDTVRLEVNGVRLKTGLKLLLGQVGLTYQVIPEDNLLVITDAQEADDRYAHILDELKSLHRDVHELQNTIDQWLEEEFPDDPDHGRLMQIATRSL